MGFQSAISVCGGSQVLVGSDGVRYAYLLKGRDDLRLDERIMQARCFAHHELAQILHLVKQMP